MAKKDGNEMIDYGPRLIKIIRDVDFMEWPEAEEDCFIDKEDNITIRFTKKHGTVIYCAGMFDDKDDLACMGAEDGKNFRIAVYTPFLEFEKGWYLLNGRSEKVKEIEKLEKLLKSSEKY